MITASEAREKLEIVIQQTKDSVTEKTLIFCQSLNPMIDDAINHNMNMIHVTLPEGVSRKEVWDFLEQMGYQVSGLRSMDHNRELRICW